MAQKPSSKAKTTPEKDAKAGDEAQKELPETTSDKAEDAKANKGAKAADSTEAATKKSEPEPKASTTEAKKKASDKSAKTSEKKTAVKAEKTSTPAPGTTKAAPEAKAETVTPPAKTVSAKDERKADGASASGAPKTTEADAKTTPATNTEAPATPEPAKTSAPATPPPAQKVSAAPLIMGGIAAGAIGFAAAFFGIAKQPGDQTDALKKELSALSENVETQSGDIGKLSTQIEGLSAMPDLSGLEKAITAQTEALSGLSERIAANETQLETLDARLRDVELKPVSESADAAAVAAYEKELDAARQELASQRAELQTLIDQALSQENAADAAAKSAMQRAAVSRILAAIDSGAAFTSALGDLQSTGADVPEALVSAADNGVAPLSSLQESFPAAARAALNATRASGSEGSSGFTGFLRNQLGARSLEPREGNDPDAILSRAEAALREGRLQDALAEIDALPEEGQAELADWVGQVKARLDVLNAAQTLSETVK